MHGTLPAGPLDAAPTPPASTGRPTPTGIGLVLRLALREMRAGLGGFGVFIACIALGTAAISGVSSVARSLVEGIATQGQVILGGDVTFSVVQRPASPEELRAMAEAGRVSEVTTTRAMAVAPGDAGAALVEAKAVGPGYPEVGAVALDPPMPLADALAARGGVWGAVADPALFDRLDLKPGARVTVGEATLELRARLMAEPDKLAAGIGFGPRLILSRQALAATGLIQPGSLYRSSYRISLPAGAGDGAPPRAAAAIRTAMPEAGAGWEVRTRDNADPRFARNIERFAQFLTLVGLTALLVGGVGVANAVAAFVDRKRVSVGILKTLGASGRRVVAIYLVQVLMLAAIGVAIGLAVGAALPFGVARLLADALPIPIAPVVSARDLALATGYGLLTALAFSLRPLGRAQVLPVSGLFRDRIAPDPRQPPRAFTVAAAAAGLALVGLAVGAAHDRRVALFFVAAALGAFVLLRLVAAGITLAARRAPTLRVPVLRLAVANLHRPGSLTPSLVLSLGLGVTLLVTLAGIDGSLRREIGSTLPERAPSFFFIDVPSGDADAFRAFLAREAPEGGIEAVPMMRGRITALNGTPAGEAHPAPEAAWVLDGDRGITYSETIPEGSTVVAGHWWKPGGTDGPQVSFDVEMAAGLGLKIGDSVTVNVLGRTVTARIANLRRIDWRRLGISFVMVFSPETFAGAPHTDLMTVTVPKSAPPDLEPRLLRDAAKAFPSVTSIRVKDALEAVNAIVAQLVFAIRAASSVALVASLLVLAGALAAGHRARLYDAVVLKTLGATRAKLVAAYAAEYGILGAATALFGLAAGLAAAFLVVTRMMQLPFSPDPLGVGGVALAAVAVAVGLGLLGTWRILDQKPARHLRGL